MQNTLPTRVNGFRIFDHIYINLLYMVYGCQLHVRGDLVLLTVQSVEDDIRHLLTVSKYHSYSSAYSFIYHLRWYVNIKCEIFFEFLTLQRSVYNL